MIGRNPLLITILLTCYLMQSSQQLKQSHGRFFRFNSNLAFPFYLPPLIGTSTYTSTSIISSTFTNTVDAYCITVDAGQELITCPARRRRSVLEEDDLVYIDNEPLKPTQVLARMMTTEVPTMAEPIGLISSMASDDEDARQSRKLKGEWLFATTTTVTLTAVTIVNSTRADPVSIVISGCIPDCLTSLAVCV